MWGCRFKQIYSLIVLLINYISLLKHSIIFDNEQTSLFIINIIGGYRSDSEITPRFELSISDPPYFLSCIGEGSSYSKVAFTNVKR